MKVPVDAMAALGCETLLQTRIESQLMYRFMHDSRHLQRLIRQLLPHARHISQSSIASQINHQHQIVTHRIKARHTRKIRFRMNSSGKCLKLGIGLKQQHR